MGGYCISTLNEIVVVVKFNFCSRTIAGLYTITNVNAKVA